MLAPSPVRPDAQFERDLVAAIPMLRRNLCKLCIGHTWMVDDLIQHACERALTRHAQFECGTNIEAWLFVIARNKFREERRRTTKWEVEDIDGLYSLSVWSKPSQENWVELAETLAGIMALPEPNRLALSMRARGYQYQEIAEAFGVPESTIKERVIRGRGLLRRQFEAQE